MRGKHRLLRFGRNLVGHFERLGIETLPKVCIGQVELDFIGIGIDLQRRLKVLDGVVV